MNNNCLIHNHPSGGGLSEMDVRMATTNGLREIISITNKGVFNRLTIKETVNIAEVMVEYRKAQMLAGSTFKRLLSSAKANKTQLMKEYQHLC